MHRFFIKEEIPDEGIFILNNEKIAHQLARVLKIREGEKIALFNGTAYDHILRVTKLSNRFISGRITEKVENGRDPLAEVHLFMALIKKDNFEWVLEKGTELGVKFFHPLLSERSVKTGVNFERARRIVTEACEQSGQNTVPEIFELVSFKDALELIGPDEAAILLDPTGDAENVRKVTKKRVDLFIGPEGGFTTRELEMARGRNIPVHSMGNRILRAETAAIAAAARVLD